MRFFVTFLMLFLSSVAYGQNKVDLNNVSKMVSQRQHIKALESVAPCLRANSVKEISNLEECLYIGEEVAIKAISDLSKKYRSLLDDMAQSTKIYDQSFYIKREEMTDKLIQPYLDLGIITRYNEIDGSWMYYHEFFKALNQKFPNSKYQEEVEYLLIESKASVNNWEQSMSKLEAYIKRHPMGQYSLLAKFDLARIYDDLWYIADPARIDKYKKYLIEMNNLQIDQNTIQANEYRNKALKLYQEIISAKDKSSLSPQSINIANKRLADIPKGIVNGSMILQSGD